MDVEIKDTRTEQHFRGMTFSGYKKCEVRRELLKNLSLSKIEPSCYWGAELISSGHYSDLWENIMFFYSKHIHVGNPKLAIYIELKIQQFKEIVNNGYINNELLMRNNTKIRELFAEIISILCVSNKKHSYDDIIITKEDFDMTNTVNIFKAPNIEYGSKWMKEGDPKGLFIAVNELTYHVSKSGGSAMKACYWVEWITEYATICKKKKEECMIDSRTLIPVNDKEKRNVVWLIWDIFNGEATARSKLIERIVNSLLHMFVLRYTSACNKRRRYILYFVCTLLCEDINMEQDMVSELDKRQIINVVKKIDSIYKQIKNNEQIDVSLLENTPKTDAEKTNKKIEIFNKLGYLYPKI